MKTVDQAIHDMLWKMISTQVNGAIYEDRPMTEVGYPFADFERMNVGYVGTKSGPVSNVNVIVNIWDEEEERANVSIISNQIIAKLIPITDAYGWKVSLSVEDSNIQIIQDRTVTPPVWRGIVTLKFDIL